MIKEAIILAGGFGTRLRSVVAELPKSMASINGRPFLEYLLDSLINQGVSSFIFSVGYKSDDISSHFGNQYRNAKISYVQEESPLGTGGAIKKALDSSTSNVILVTNGDTLFLANINDLFKAHQEKKADVTLALKPMEDFDRYGTVVLSEDHQILKFIEKRRVQSGEINGGVYLFNRTAFDKFNLPEKFSIENDFFEKFSDQLQLFGYVDDAYFLDIGIPTDYEKAKDEFPRLKY